MATVAAPAACTALPTPARPPTLTASTSTYKKGELQTTGIKYNRFKAQQLTKDEIEATDEKQASVNQLSEWLANETTKKNKKPPVHHHRPLTTGGQTSNNHPVRFATKPRIKRSDVEATDDKRVSVKTLSSWMSDDPFEQKKNLRIVRTGHNVIVKSRVFEKDMELQADRQCDIRPGSVEERLVWLSGAFKHESEEDNVPAAEAMVAEKKVRPYLSNPKCEELQIEPTLELMSVREKKEWLSNAFKKGGNGVAIPQTKSFEENATNNNIHLTKSFGIKYDNTSIVSIVKSATFGDSCVPTIDATKSIDRIGRLSTANSFEKQSMVHLNELDENKNEVRPEEALKSNVQAQLKHHPVTDLQLAIKLRQRLLVAEGVQGSSSAVEKEIRCNREAIHSVDFNKGLIVSRTAGPSTINLAMNERPHAPGIDDIDDKLSVANRAKWLKGAFKK